MGDGRPTSRQLLAMDRLAVMGSSDPEFLQDLQLDICVTHELRSAQAEVRSSSRGLPRPPAGLYAEKIDRGLNGLRAVGRESVQRRQPLKGDIDACPVVGEGIEEQCVLVTVGIEVEPTDECDDQQEGNYSNVFAEELAGNRITRYETELVESFFWGRFGANVLTEIVWRQS